MNRPRKLIDYAHMESFFHSTKAEDLHGGRFDNDEQLRLALRSQSVCFRRYATSLTSPSSGISAATMCQLKQCKMPCPGRPGQTSVAKR